MTARVLGLLFLICGATGLWAGPMPHSLNVKDFGAVGDGVHDDTLAIQRAADRIAALVAKENGGIDAMSRRVIRVMDDGPAKELFFPKGVYRVTGPVMFTGNAFLRGERGAVVSNGTCDRETFYFHLGFRVDVIGLGFRGGRNQLVQYTANRDTASARIADCTFERASGTAVLLDCQKEIDPSGKKIPHRLCPTYDISRAADGRVILADRDPKTYQRYANSTLILIERCVFRNNACSLDAWSDGVYVDRCRFFADATCRDPVIRTGTTADFRRIEIRTTGRVPGRAAVLCGAGTVSLSEFRVSSEDDMPFALAHQRDFDGRYSSCQFATLSVRGVELDTGAGPVVLFADGCVSDRVSVSDVKRTPHRFRDLFRGRRAKKALAFERTPSLAEFEAFAKTVRHKRHGRKGAFGVSFSGMVADDFDLSLPEAFADLVRDPGFGIRTTYEYGEGNLPDGKVFSDDAIGADDRRQSKDDTDRIEALLRSAAASGGGRIVLPPRWITLSRTLSVPDNVRLTASGRAILTIADDKTTAFRVSGSGNILFENLVIRGGDHAVEVVGGGGRVRAFGCNFCDQLGPSILARSGGGTRTRLEVKYGESFTSTLYDGDADAVFEAIWFQLSSIYTKADWVRPGRTAKAQVGIVNRPGGHLKMLNVLGVPCVYWNVPKSGPGSGGFYQWAGNPPSHPELYGDFRWVDNYGDFKSFQFRYGGEWAGLTPVYQYGEKAKTLVSGQFVGGMSYGWLNGGCATVVSDTENADVTLDEVLYTGQTAEPIQVRWRSAGGEMRPARGWKAANCYPMPQKSAKP